MRRSVAAAGGLLALALVIPAGGTPLGAQLLAAGTKPQTPPAATPPPKSLTVTGPTAFAPGLAPGSGPQTFTVVVGNPKQNTGVVIVESVVAAVTSVRRGTATVSCRVGVDIAPAQQSSYDMLVTSYRKPAAGPVIALERQDSKPVPLTVEMFNRPLDQDACKGATVSMQFTATGSGR